MENERNKLIREILFKITKEEINTFNYLLPKVFSKKIISYMSIREDLLLIIKQVNFLLDYKYKVVLIDQNYREAVVQGIWSSIVITYGRCFTDASKSSKSKLEPLECFSHKNETLKITHDYIMSIRHNFVAHRGETEHDVSVAYMKIPKFESNPRKTEFRIKSIRTVSPKEKILLNCKELITHLLKIVESKLQKQTEKIHKVIFNDLDPELLNELLII